MTSHTYRRCRAFFALAALLTLFWLPQAAHAQISLSLSPTPITALPGDVGVSVFGSLTNSGTASVDLNNAFFNLLSGPGGSDLTSAIFLSNYSAPLTLSAGQVYSGELFTVDIDQNAPLGVYGGNFSVAYGDQTVGKDVSFDLVSSTPVPEASTLSLLGLGLAVIGVTLVRRRRELSA